MRLSGVNRASLGVQSFDPIVQRAINRVQSFEQTADVVDMLSKREVFVIDTDAASREQLSTALQQSAYDVICFADGASLLSEAKARMPACVLMELPPDRSGLDMVMKLLFVATGVSAKPGWA